MALDQECPRKVVKSYHQKRQKEEKFSQRNKLDKLRKRSEFLGLRKKCSTFFGTTIISNYKISDTSLQSWTNRYKKVGSAVVKIE